jgi:hypothetical protein
VGVCRYHKANLTVTKGTKDMAIAEKIQTLSTRLKEKGAVFAGLVPTSAEVRCKLKRGHRHCGWLLCAVAAVSPSVVRLWRDARRH